MNEELIEELDFVGAKRRVPWFNKNLVADECFISLIEDVLKRCKEVSLRTVLYSILPIVEYVAHIRGINLERLHGEDAWLDVIREHRSEIEDLVVRCGTQGNVPQRAAIILDYIHRKDLFSSTSGTVYELGCSAGFLGTVLCSPFRFFHWEGGELSRRLFWLKREPCLRRAYNISYKGYDKVLPSNEMVPFYVWDKDKREKVVAFTQLDKPCQVELFEDSFEHALESVRGIDFETVIILTSFVLYQLPKPEPLVEEIMSILRCCGNVHWLDLSRNSGLDCLFKDRRRLIPHHVYLSHDGMQVAHVVDGSDDCPNWEYL